MKVIVMNRTTMDIIQYNNVLNIAYNSSGGTFTITYGAANTKSYSIAQYTIHIMES